VADNQCGAATGATGTIGYLVGYQNALTSRSCDASDPFFLQFETGVRYMGSGGNAIATQLNACSTSIIDPAFKTHTVTGTMSGSGLTVHPLNNYKTTVQAITIRASDTLTIGTASYADQSEIVEICQSGSGHTPSFALSGVTLDGAGTFPTCATTLAACDFQIYFKTPSTAFIAGLNGSL
jgi:hypothetical protein